MLALNLPTVLPSAPPLLPAFSPVSANADNRTFSTERFLFVKTCKKVLQQTYHPAFILFLSLSLRAKIHMENADLWATAKDTKQ